jgi:hypothetical protein
MTLLDEAPVSDTAGRLLRHAQEVNDRVRRTRPDLRLDALPRDGVLKLLSALWHTSAPDLELTAMDRGFTSIDHAVTAARPFYLFARFNETTARRLASSLMCAGRSAPPSRGLTPDPEHGYPASAGVACS